LFEGQISAQARGMIGRGGMVEVSGKRQLTFAGGVSTLSVGGSTGTLLLDPTDFQVVTTGAGANQITATDLIAQLAGSDVVISTSGAGVGTDAGTITVEAGANVHWNDPTSLTLLAYQDINIYAD